MSISDTALTKEQRLFYARLDDLGRRARGGIVAHSAFLTPSEAMAAGRYLAAQGYGEGICFFGGYFEAQRKQIFLLPDYIDTDGVGDMELYEMLRDTYDEAMCALALDGSGFRTLTHRDYMGSVLALGIERDAIGDICVRDDSSALLVCTPDAARLILSELTSVGRDTVKVRKTELDVNMPSTQRYQPMSDTVASERLDCVVAALCSLSRERAQGKISAGLVELNYEMAEKNDVRVGSGDIISVRGCGKFAIRDLSSATRKGRLRLFADKYI